MKAKRLTALVLTVMMFLCSFDAQAVSGILLPKQITAIETEAFADDPSVDGLLELPSGVKTIGDRAFAGTHVHAISMPSGTQSVGHRIASGAIYAYASGTKTAFSSDSLQGIRYAFGNACMSGAGAGTFYPLSEISEESGFYYHTANGTAELLCAVDPDAIGSAITIPESISARNIAFQVARIAADAFAGCSRLNSISIPYAVHTDSDAFRSIPAASVTYYGDGFYIESLRSSVSTAEAGDNVIWVVKTSTPAVYHRFDLIYLGEDPDLTFETADSPETVSKTLTGSTNYLSLPIERAGTYVVQLTCRDADGASVTRVSDPVVIQEGPVKAVSIAPESITVASGSDCTWSALYEGGHGGYSFRFTLTSGGTVIASSSTTSLSMRAIPEGDYTLTFTVSDADGCTDTIETTCTVINEELLSPPAPVLTSGNMSKDEAGAPVFETQDLVMTWESVSSAETYSLTLEKKENGIWSGLLDTDRIKGCRYALSAAALAVSEETLFRAGLYSQNLGDGETTWYYFKVKPVTIDWQVYINGAAQAAWNQANAVEGVHEFTITSAAEWTAASDSDWAVCQKSGELLTVTIARNHTSATRKATVTVSNGTTSATLTIQQGTEFLPPEITFPAMSEDPDHPTTVGTGILSYKWTKNSAPTVLIEAFSKTTTGWSRLFWARSAGTSYTLPDNSTYRLVSGKDYRIRITGIWDANYASNEQASMQLYRDYYVKASNEENTLLVNGRSNVALDLNDGGIYSDYFTIYASSVYTVTSDVDWLSLYTAPTYGLTVNTYLVAQPNMTGSSRTGHLTLTCGSATATITTTQPSMLPRIIQPALSTSASSPTSMSKNYIGLVFYGAGLTIEKLSGSSYVDAGIDTSDVETSFTLQDFEIQSDSLTANTTYRLTVTSGDASSAYYLKTGSEDTSYVYINSSSSKSWLAPASGASTEYTISATGSWTAASNASWLTISVTSGASTSGTKVTVTAAKNTTGSPRIGTITLKRGTTFAAYLTVEQAGNDVFSVCFTENGSQNLTVPGDKDYPYIRLIHTGKATLTSSADWITFSNSKTTYSTSTASAQIKLNVAANNTGSPRTGTITVVDGAYSSVLTITQRKGVAAPVLTSPAFSTDIDAPTYVPDGKMTLKWNAVPGAEWYRIRVVGESAELNEYVPSGVTSFEVPLDLLALYERYYVRIYVNDSYGGSYPSEYYYFTLTTPNIVMLDRQQNPVWNNVDDMGAKASYTVQCASTWTASTSASWLTLSPSGGSAGDQLTVTASENLGAKRTGTVTVTCGSASATLTVTQCAYLDEEYQPLLSPTLSSDIAHPSVLPAGTTSLTMKWNVLPQAAYYQVRLLTQKTNSTRTAFQNSGLLTDGLGTYTFSGLSLQPGVIYVVSFLRSCSRWKATSTPYYFIIEDPSDSVTAEEDKVYLEGTNDCDYIDVTASGSWVAYTSDPWLMVSGTFKDETEVDDAAYYNSFMSNGDPNYVCVSALSNGTGNSRTGTVHIRCGGAETSFQVFQSTNYTMAELTNLTLSRKSSAPSSIGYADLALAWSASSGGTGTYEVTLKKRVGISYEKVWSKTLNSLSTTIPKSYLTEGSTYMLFLGTEANGEENIYGNRYYFKVAYENELVLNLDVDWSRVASDGFAYVQASAGGGSGSYQYAYELLKNGTSVKITEWMNQSYYSFAMNEGGSYTVRVHLKDSAGTTVTQDSLAKTVSEAETSRVTLSSASWNAPASGGSVSIAVTATGTWSVSSTQAWVTCEPSGNTLLLKASENQTADTRTAVVTVTCGMASKTITVTQPSAQATGSLALSSNTWTLDTVFSAETTLTITSDSPWSVVSDSLPAWLTLSSLSGANGDTLMISCSTNQGTARTAVLTFVSGTASATLTVSQPGTDSSAQVLSSAVNGLTLVGTPTAFRVNVKNADSLSFMVDGVIDPNRITVTNGWQNVSYTFAAGGDHAVQVIPYRNGSMGAPLDMGNVHIRDFGSLQTPVLSYSSTMLQGAAQTLKWATIPDAESYSVILKYEGTTCKTWVLPPEQTELELTADVMMDIGTYTVLFCAQAYGYNPSSTACMITTRMPQINFSITSPKAGDAYVKGDLMDIQVSNPDGYNIAIKVTPENASEEPFWIPADGTTRSDTLIQQAFYFHPTASQVYTFEPMAWATTAQGTEARAWHDSTKAVSISINGPIIRSMQINNTASTIRMQSSIHSLTVVTNKAVNCVELYIDGSASPAEIKANASDYTVDASTNRTWTFNLASPSAGAYHTYRIAASEDVSASGTCSGKTIGSSYSFYCVQDETQQIIYANTKGVQLYSYPVATGASHSPGIVEMMERCLLLGRYGSFLYISSPVGTGFVPSSQMDSHITYDAGRIDVEFIENSQGTVYTYIGAPQLKLAWQSNIDTSTSDLRYRVKLTPSSGSAIYGTYQKASWAGWKPSKSGTYTVSLELYDIVQNLLVKTAQSSTTYVVYANKQEYINNRSEFDREIIRLQGNTFQNSLNYFTLIDVEQTANNVASKIYQLIDLNLDRFVETEHSQAVTLAEGILCNIAASESDADAISFETFVYIMKCLGLPNDILDAVTHSVESLQDFKLTDVGVVKKITTALEDVLKNHFPTLSEHLGKAGKKLKSVGLDPFSVAALAAQLTESIINAVIVANQFAKVSSDQIQEIREQLISTGNSVLTKTADKMAAYTTLAGKVGYAAGKVSWTAIRAALDVGVAFSKKKALEAAGMTILTGVFIGITIGTGVCDIAANTGNITTAATEAKWAVNALKNYWSTFDTAYKAFVNNATAGNYQAFARAVLSCRQLMLVAYSKMIAFMQQYDKSWFNSADYESSARAAQSFESNTNSLMESLDKYWDTWLSDECSQVEWTVSSAFSGS